jgi:hypothetical protein
MTENPIMESGNPIPAKQTPYIMAVVILSALTIVGVVMVIVLRPGAMDNAIMVAAIIGFATTTGTSLLAYMRSTETREVVNSRMDEFKRTLQTAATNAEAAAHAAGRAEGRSEADARTDKLATDQKLP